MNNLELLSLKRANNLLSDDSINLYCLVHTNVRKILEKNFPEIERKNIGILLDSIYKEFENVTVHVGEVKNILMAIIEDRCENNKDNK